MLLGDFNMLQDSREYAEIAGRPDPEFGSARLADLAVDAALAVARAEGGVPDITWIEPKTPDDRALWKRIDYGFVWPGLADRLKAARVDLEADGSDHKPLWLEFA